MRAERERAHLPPVALAGYTNAGKSTLLNALTGATVGVRDRLFHTLDPTTRVLRAGGRDYLLTDTVGFIRKLPHQLVDAFGATLEETRLADLILHVVDASAPEEELLAMTRAVEDVLHEIGADEAPRVLVLGKADLIDEERRAELANRHPDAVLVSAVTGEGLAALTERIEDEFARTLQEVELLIPYDEGGRLAELHDARGRPRARGDARRRPRARAAAGRASPRATSRSRSAAAEHERCGFAASTRARRCRPAPIRATRASTCTRSRAAVLEPGERASVRHRDRGRDPRRAGRARAAALGAGGASRDRARQRPRADRRRLPRRDPGAAAQHRPRARRSRSPPATGSRSSCSSGSRRRRSLEVEALALSERGDGGFGSSGT